MKTLYISFNKFFYDLHLENTNIFNFQMKFKCFSSTDSSLFRSMNKPELRHCVRVLFSFYCTKQTFRIFFSAAASIQLLPDNMSFHGTFIVVVVVVISAYHSSSITYGFSVEYSDSHIFFFRLVLVARPFIVCRYQNLLYLPSSKYVFFFYFVYSME